MRWSEYKVEVYVPKDAFDVVVNAIKLIGIGKMGNYSNCMSWYEVNSSWHAEETAMPYLGVAGDDKKISEYKIEFRCKQEQLSDVVATIKRVHPYEECCVNIIPLISE